VAKRAKSVKLMQRAESREQEREEALEWRKRNIAIRTAARTRQQLENIHLFGQMLGSMEDIDGKDAGKLAIFK
jgi:hypothetical protein